MPLLDLEFWEIHNLILGEPVKGQMKRYFCRIKMNADCSEKLNNKNRIKLS